MPGVEVRPGGGPKPRNTDFCGEGGQQGSERDATRWAVLPEATSRVAMTARVSSARLYRNLDSSPCECICGV